MPPSEYNETGIHNGIAEVTIVRTVHGAGDPPVAPVYVASCLFVHLRHLGEDPFRVVTLFGEGEVPSDIRPLRHQLPLDIQPGLAKLSLYLLLR